ncbi:hypothetical protein D3C75_757960 [compost metagenome]
MDAEADPAHDGVGQAGLLPHVAGQVHEAADHQCAEREGCEDLCAAHAQGEEADGEGIVGDVVHIVGPQCKQAVAPPGAICRAGRCKVGTVKARAQLQLSGPSRFGGENIKLADTGT